MRYHRHASRLHCILVSQLLDVPGLNSRRRRAPQEVANEQQARDMGIPAGVNLQRSASPGEIHRRVRDERMTQRLRQYEVGSWARPSRSQRCSPPVPCHHHFVITMLGPAFR
jgi:hypothetical protein